MDDLDDRPENGKEHGADEPFPGSGQDATAKEESPEYGDGWEEDEFWANNSYDEDDWDDAEDWQGEDDEDGAYAYGRWRESALGEGRNRSDGGPAMPDGEPQEENAHSHVQNSAKEPHPVVITGRTIAESWWGRAWCENLERYADYRNRIGRGKAYVRAGAVIDLQISEGRINALVQGSRKAPYRVGITIKPMSKRRSGQVSKRCGSRIENMEELLSGNFPEDLRDLFQGKDGLFPKPNEISFTCSCPDWARMCKHVAATLYGVGARLDSSPALFFELRGLDIGKFIDVSLEEKTDRLLKKAKRPSRRIIPEGEHPEKLFGFDDLIGKDSDVSEDK